MLMLSRAKILTLCFAVTVIAASSFAGFGWMFGWYVQGQLVFFVLTLAFAWLLIRESRQKWQMLTVASLGLAIANWGLIQMTAMTGFWTMRGFAP